MLPAAVPEPPPAVIADAYPGKARYAPGEPVSISIELGAPPAGAYAEADILALDRIVGACRPNTTALPPATRLTLSCTLPSTDFQGYLVTVRLRDADGRTLDTRLTAIDVSSDWARFPRYAYLAWFSHASSDDPLGWVDQLNRFHIDGLQFYDFQYRHERPLAGPVSAPASRWIEISGREVDADILQQFLDQAHRRNMIAMAYDASYAAYGDALSGPGGLPLAWATWPTRDTPRTAATVKSFDLDNPGWSTQRLLYMNQNDPAWRRYIFARMADLMQVYPFDGWHIDTYGALGAYAFDGSRVDFVAGFRSFADEARVALGKRVLLNTVNGYGQDDIARSSADFVYSELWGGHETFASILATADEVHRANPDKALVLAAYLHRHGPRDGPNPTGMFNPPAVLLADAAIFASGASHIELGDGDRMASSEYWPDDMRLRMSPELHEALRHYYDYLTAYEAYLGYADPIDFPVKVPGYRIDGSGSPGSIWSIARQRGDITLLHLINLLHSVDGRWRDIRRTAEVPPFLRDLVVEIPRCDGVTAAGWASPDIDGGLYHPLPLKSGAQAGSCTVVLPSLSYWSTIFLRR